MINKRKKRTMLFSYHL